MDQIKLNKLLVNCGVTQSNANIVSPILQKYFDKYSFEDKNILYILANMMTETGNFSAFKENLNYSAARLCAVFPSLFKSIDIAQPYANNPTKLANYVYDSNVRLPDMKNFNPGDASKYIGRGCLQTTGKANYEQLSKIVGVDFVNSPELLEQPEYAVQSAVVYWQVNKLSDKPNLKEMRKGVAGSYFGYEDHVLPIYNKLSAAYSKI